MRYAIKNAATGQYVGGESWLKSGRDSLAKAKLYHRRGDALAHIKRWPYHYRDAKLVLVTVDITPVKEEPL